MKSFIGYPNDQDHCKATFLGFTISTMHPAYAGVSIIGNNKDLAERLSKYNNLMFKGFFYNLPLVCGNAGNIIIDEIIRDN
jgi:hypothetical protein